jgi:hypothetical protein
MKFEDFSAKKINYPSSKIDFAKGLLVLLSGDILKFN